MAKPRERRTPVTGSPRRQGWGGAGLLPPPPAWLWHNHGFDDVIIITANTSPPPVLSFDRWSELSQQRGEVVIFRVLIYARGNGASEGFRDLPRVTQFVSGTAGMQVQAGRPLRRGAGRGSGRLLADADLWCASPVPAAVLNKVYASCFA